MQNSTAVYTDNKFDLTIAARMAEDHQMSDGEPPTITIDKRGDVILVVGMGQPTAVKLLVSSNILSLASKVFDALLSGLSAEAQNLSPTPPREFPLPDDDPDQMTNICKLVHMQSSDVVEKLDIGPLVDFALLCHKYDCAMAVRPWIRICMSYYGLSSPDLEQLLAIAYLLDLPHEFRDFSRRLLLCRNGIESAKFVLREQERVPYQVLNDLGSRLLIYRLRVTRALIPNSTSGMIERTVLHSEDRSQAELVVAAFVQTLITAGISPSTSEPLVKYVVRARRLRPQHTQCPSQYRHGSERWNAMMHTFMDDLEHDLEEIMDTIEGSCLDCAKFTILGEAASHCRVEHEEHDLPLWN